MSGMYKQFGTNKGLEVTGVAVDYGPFRITIARAGGANKQFEQVLEGRLKPYRRAIQTNTIDKFLMNSITREVFVQTCLKNWEVKIDPKGDPNDNANWKQGIEGEDGQVLPFNAENAINVFKELPDLYDDLQGQAVSATLFQIGVREADAGN